MASTIQASEQLKDKLGQLKLYDRETYEEVIWNLIEDGRELSAQAQAALAEAEADVAAGRLHDLDAVKRELEL